MTTFESFVMWVTWIVMLGFIIINALQHTGIMYRVEVLEVQVEDLNMTKESLVEVQYVFSDTHELLFNCIMDISTILSERRIGSTENPNQFNPTDRKEPPNDNQ